MICIGTFGLLFMSNIWNQVNSGNQISIRVQAIQESRIIVTSQAYVGIKTFGFCFLGKMYRAR